MPDIINLTNPYPIISNSSAVSIKVEILELILYTSCSFRVTFYDANSVPVDCKVLTMSGYEYTDWQGTDTYALNWIRTQLGIS
jgi:hypothetical protein